MAKRVGGAGPSAHQSWISRIADQRPAPPARAGRVEPSRDGLDVARASSGSRERRDALAALGVPEKLLDEHGRHLDGALADLTGLIALGDRMEPWRRKQLERALAQVFKVLHLQLTRAAEGDRADLASRTLGALRGLAEAVGAPDLVMPALYAAAGLIDSGVRLEAQKRLRSTPAEAARAPGEAKDAVLGLLGALQGRTGLASALNVYANLVEQVERATPELTARKRPVLWAATASLLSGSTPRRGFDQAAAAELAELTQRAIAAGASGQEALEVAARELEAKVAPRREQALGQIRAQGDQLAVGTPGRQCIDHLTAALGRVLLEHPLGPEQLFEAAEALQARAVEQLRNPRAEVLQGWGCAAAILASAAKTNAPIELCAYFAQLLPQAAGRPAVAQALQRAVDSRDLTVTARELVWAQLAVRGWQPAGVPGLPAAVEDLAGLEPGLALQAVVVLAPHAGSCAYAPALARALADLARRGGGDDLPRTMAGFAARFSGLSNRLAAWLGHGDKVAPLSARIARATAQDNLPQAFADQVGKVLRAIQTSLPRADLEALATRDAAGRPGVAELLDPSIRRRHPPAQFVEALLNPMRAALQHDPARQNDVARLALELSARLGNLDGEWQLPFQGRIVPDWAQALQNPARLTYSARPAAGTAIRAQQAGTVEAFLAAHPELPLELAFTAGLHLDREQLAWVIERAGSATGRDTVRSLRDFVFACVDANRKDLIDIARTSPSPAKAISGTIAEIGREYRADRLAQLPWDELAAGLREGRDPLALLEKRRVEAGLAGLNLAELGGPNPDPAGMDTIARCAPAITSCLQYYEQQKALYPRTDAQIDYAPIIPAFMAVLRSVADGTWPRVKYENEVGRRLLSILTPEQEQLWRSEVVTSLGGAGDAGNDGGRDALVLLRGLMRAIPREVVLSKALAPIGFDAASKDKLTRQRGELLAELHDVEKGSPRHRELGDRLGLVGRNLAVIELQLALGARLAGPAGPEQVDGQPPLPVGQNARALLTDLRPLLQDAARALRALGAPGSAAAATEALFAAEAGRTAPRQGRYAVDEDSLESLIMSHTQASGSCLNYQTGFRRWGLAGSAADANIRMLRSYDGEKFGYRAFLKLFPVELQGYAGPGLWIDAPMREGGGQPEDLQLLYRTAIRKASAMGVPLMGTDQNLAKEGQAAGLATRQEQVTFSIDEGNTGAQHSDSLFGGAGNVRKSRGANPHWVIQKNVQIVLPPKD